MKKICETIDKLFGVDFYPPKIKPFHLEEMQMRGELAIHGIDASSGIELIGRRDSICTYLVVMIEHKQVDLQVWDSETYYLVWVDVVATEFVLKGFRIPKRDLDDADKQRINLEYYRFPPVTELSSELEIESLVKSMLKLPSL